MKKDVKEEADYSESNYDEFSGYRENLFTGMTYDAEDKEADIVYSQIDQRMDSRRKRQREEIEKKEEEEARRKRPVIQEQFKDLKRELGKVSSSEWESIPESKDLSRQNQFVKKRKEQFTAATDNLVMSSLTNIKGQQTAMLDPRQQKYGGIATPLNGMMTPIGSGLMTPLGGMSTPIGSQDLTGLRGVRNKVLSLKLDRVADSVSGQTVVDPKNFLTDLNSIKVSNEAEVSDIKKARLLLKSVITTNPKHAPGWIAAARLEKETGRLTQARNLIAKGCEACPTNEDVWLEAVRLSPPKDAKGILAKAVQQIPHSVKLWMKAKDLEEDQEAKSAVLRRALEIIPKSVALWKAAIELESPEDARIMLGRAVELIQGPESVDMWLALARLETYENARIVLNKAREALPTEPQIWLAAAKLEEANGNVKNVDAIISKANKSLAAHNVVIDREQWIHEAEVAERGKSISVCQAIIRATIGIGVEEQDQRTTWSRDAEECLSRGSAETARAIYAHMLTVFPAKKSVWMLAAQLEKQHGTRESLDQVLARAVDYCPQAEVLWLMRAKEQWLGGDVDKAREILESAFRANPESEQIWLAAVKLERENKGFQRARMLLAKARERAATPRVWRHSARLERLLGANDKEKELLEEGIKKFPNYAKLYIMLAEQLSDEKQYDAAREVYKRVAKACPDSVDVWVSYAKMEVAVSSNYSRARSILETARQKIPANPQLWLTAIRVEQKAAMEKKGGAEAGEKKVADTMIAKALQECPKAGLLWAHAIASDGLKARKARSYDALKQCTDDVHVFAAVAKLFWFDRKVKKARSWFQRAVTVDPSQADIWAAYYKFELEHGTAETQADVLKKANEAEPRNGEKYKVLKRRVENHSLKTEDYIKRIAESTKDIFEIFPTGNV